MLLVRAKRTLLCSTLNGVITDDRANLTEQKKEFATSRRDVHTLAEAIRGADVFVGLSKGNVLSKDMVRTMAERPMFLLWLIRSPKSLTKTPSKLVLTS